MNDMTPLESTSVDMHDIPLANVTASARINTTANAPAETAAGSLLTIKPITPPRSDDHENMLSLDTAPALVLEPTTGCTANNLDATPLAAAANPGGHSSPSVITTANTAAQASTSGGGGEDDSDEENDYVSHPVILCPSHTPS